MFVPVGSETPGDGASAEKSPSLSKAIPPPKYSNLLVLTYESVVAGLGIELPPKPDDGFSKTPNRKTTRARKKPEE